MCLFFDTNEHFQRSASLLFCLLLALANETVFMVGIYQGSDQVWVFFSDAATFTPLACSLLVIAVLANLTAASPPANNEERPLLAIVCGAEVSFVLLAIASVLLVPATFGWAGRACCIAVLLRCIFACLASQSW